MSQCKLDKYACCFSHLEALHKASSAAFFVFQKDGRMKARFSDKFICVYNMLKDNVLIKKNLLWDQNCFRHICFYLFLSLLINKALDL